MRLPPDHLPSSALPDLLAPLSDPVFGLVLLAVVAGGLVRGFTGFGVAMVYIPVVAALTDPQTAVATLFIFDSVVILPLILGALRHVDWKEIAPMAAGAIAMVPLGAWTLLSVDPVPLRWAISIVILAALVLIAAGWRYRGPTGPWLSAGVGGMSGYLSGLAQLPGPPVVLYWLGQARNPISIRASSIVLFAITTIASGVAFSFAGLFTAEVVAMSVWTVPVFCTAVYCGTRLFPLASPATYSAIAYALIAAAGLAVMPVFDGLVR